ncbi:hypothetical protein ABZX85_17435 [Streptomyces sp. NPDC004539]|uniref:hypothetical protein n=1 Tax=Streptomyces sp. NPDC004539 TaxID=3154280 RepID=UPI0033AE19AF
MPRPAAAPLPSVTFRDDELVFSHGGYQLLDGFDVPRFGDTHRWQADCIGRPANKAPGDWTITFYADDLLMNLQLREFCFALLNPAHPTLRTAAIFLSAVPRSLATIRAEMGELRVIMRWGRERRLPADLGLWDPEDWYDAVAHKAATVTTGKTIATHVGAVRRLRQLAPVITGISPFTDPWEGKTAKEVGKEAIEAKGENATTPDGLATPSIPPETWWPVLRAAWTYIHTFAPDIFRWRDHFDREAARHSDRPPAPGPQPPRLDDVDALLTTWLNNPDNAVPVHDHDTQAYAAGTPMWTVLSRQVTDGASRTLFALNGSHRAAARRATVLTAIASGRIHTVRVGMRYAKSSAAPAHAPHRQRQDPGRQELDEDVRRWLADAAHLVPVYAPDDPGKPSQPVLATVARMIWGSPPAGVDRQRYARRFSPEKRTGRERTRWLQEAISAGRTTVVDTAAGVGWRSLPLPCPDAASVRRPDGSSGPWRMEITAEGLAFELHMLRAAVYVLLSAITMMRDSEIQEIQRDSLRTYFGSPAVVSHKTKKDPARPELHWWIIEPAAEAIAVAERLSWHPTHLFATLQPTRGERAGRHGIDSERELDFFVQGVNAVCAQYGLEKIPPAHVRSHMFRKTMSSLTARDPDAEIALGLQLKHAARRAMSNRVTDAYGKMDTAWAKEFDKDLENAAALKLVELLRDRRAGQRVAVGPGATRLHMGLDKVIASMNGDPQLRAHIADERVEAALLSAEFPNLFLGTLNHCMFDAPQAECQDQLPDDQRGVAPLLGACQPARCRNSTITRKHAPYWVAEEDDLNSMAKDSTLSPPRREAVLVRLADVRLVTRALDEDGAA